MRESSLQIRFFLLLNSRSVADLADMVAVGLGLPADTFRQAGRYGFAFLILLFAS